MTHGLRVSLVFRDSKTETHRSVYLDVKGTLIGRRSKDNSRLRGTMAKLTSFQADIRSLFTERDIRGMSKAFNLGSYDDVKAHAAAIYDRIRGIGGAVMPPPPPRGEGPWPQSRIELFAKWMADGYQP
jgi:hypothetical protein